MRCSIIRRSWHSLLNLSNKYSELCFYGGGGGWEIKDCEKRGKNKANDTTTHSSSHQKVSETNHWIMNWHHEKMFFWGPPKSSYLRNNVFGTQWGTSVQCPRAWGECDTALLPHDILPVPGLHSRWPSTPPQLLSLEQRPWWVLVVLHFRFGTRLIPVIWFS